MAVELNNLYNEIYSKHDVRLQTTSCFDKKIRWVHMVENIEFANLLHGDELVFNSSLNYETEQVRKAYIQQLIQVEAGGLIIAVQKGNELSQDVIDYCNQMQFPVFIAGWETSYLNIMRRFSEILLDNERKEMNLIAALKNAIHHPQDVSLYQDYFERNNFANDMYYMIAITGFPQGEDSTEYLKPIESFLQRNVKNSILFEEKKNFIILVSGYSTEYLKQFFSNMYRQFPAIRLGIGEMVNQIANISRSYHSAQIAYHLSAGIIPSNPLSYDAIGTYQILADMKEPERICPAFVQDTLGELIDYDLKHKTKYMTVLKDFFENDCSITQTADATFYHQNTLKYKIKNIKEILGYDIMTNENRVRIMLSLYILRITEYIYG